jgi:hypothetical protein
VFVLGFSRPAFSFSRNPVAVAADVDGDRMMPQSIEDGGGDLGVSEDLAPGAKALIARQDDGAAVAPGDELEEQVGALAVNRDVPDLIDNQQLWLRQDLEALIESAFGERLAEGRNQAGGRGEEHADALFAGLQPERDGQVRLADTGRSEEQDIVATFQVAVASSRITFGSIDG